MNRLTKVIYFGVLAIVSAIQLLQGNTLLSAILFGLTCLALPFYEKREAKRHFYRALRKLYVCVDLDAFIKEREKLVTHALIKGSILKPLRVLTAIEAYYNGQRDSVVQDLASMPKIAAYQFWIDCYIGMCDTSRISQLQMGEHLKSVPRYYREIAVQRFEVLVLLDKLHVGNAVDTREIEALRERVTVNLLIAELTKCLSDHTQNERIRKYYEQAAINLSKGLKI